MTRLSRFAAAVLMVLPWAVQAQNDQPKDSVQRLTLPEAIQMAQEQGQSGKIAKISRDGARWAHRAFNARFLPKISLSGQVPSFSRSIAPVTQPDGTIRFLAVTQTQSSLAMRLEQQIPFTGGSLSLSSSLSRANFGSIDGSPGTQYWSASQVVMGYSQPLFRLNTMSWDRRQERLQNEIAERSYLEAREDVAAGTVSVFFGLFSAKSSLDNAILNARTNDSLYRINKGRFEIGKIAENDLLQSELAMIQASAAAEEAKLSYDRAVAALRRQVGLPSVGQIEVVIPAEIPDFAVDTALAVDQALKNQSAAINRDLQEVQSKRAVKEAKQSAGFTANLNVGAGYNQSGTTFRDAYSSPLGSQQLGISVDMPLIQWGAGKARVESAKLNAQRTEMSIALEEEKAAEDAYFAAIGVVRARSQLLLAAKADTIATKRYEVAMARFIINKIDVPDLYVAQTEKDRALQSYIQALGNYWTAYYRLRKVTLFDFVTGKEIDS